MSPKIHKKSQWNIIEALNWTADYFRKNNIPTPRLDAEVLLAEALGVDRISLYTHFDQPLSDSERSRYRSYVKRRIVGEPVSYIRNKKEFWSRTLFVDPRVLIPRPETETVVEVVKGRLEERKITGKLDIIDMCCGSGAIAIAIASFVSANLFLVDIDPNALTVATMNCRTYAEDGPFLLACCDLFEAFRPRPSFDLIVSNPPYVSREDLPKLPDGIRKFEPVQALEGGINGMEVIQRLIAQSPSYLKRGGLFATEIAPEQAETVKNLIRDTESYSDIRLDRDLAGHPRVISAWRN